MTPYAYQSPTMKGNLMSDAQRRHLPPHESAWATTKLPRRRQQRSIRGRSISSLAAGVLAVGAVVTATTPASGTPATPLTHVAGTARHTAPLASDLREDLEAYLRSFGTAEHASGVGLSVSLPGARSNIDVTAGATTYEGPKPLSASTLWQIGSNTKAFTSVLLLQLEAENRLSIDDTLGKWLPQYHRWHDVTIRSLLNMTSGIPTYDEQSSFLSDYAAQPDRYFSKEQLVGYVLHAPPVAGYSYSNTGYVLAEMIIEKVGGDTYAHQLYQRIIRPLDLKDTHYREHLYPRWVTEREPAGYFYLDGVPPMAGQLGRDVHRDTLSWARAAGGIASTLRDMTVWERAMYGGRLLPAIQQKELLSLVSTATGKPIDHTSTEDPSGFGLGVQQGISKKLGTFWVYLGGTFGFRVLHLYFPKSGIIMAVGVNSQPTQSALPALAESIHDTLDSHGLIPTTK
jgi:D-alanyl-D-alanine carboxypeptidase